MSDELKSQIEAELSKLNINTESKVSEEVSSDEQEQQVSELSEIEQKAIEMGWDPEHKGKSFVSAKEFVERGSFFRKIDAQNKKIDELMNVVKELSAHNQKVADASYNKGLEDALRNRAKAVEFGDVEAFEEAERTIKNLESSKPTLKQETVNQAPSQEMLDFVKENESWFNTSTAINKRMVLEADGLYTLEKQDNPDLSDKEILNIVKQKIELLHPEQFTNPNKLKPAAVTKSTTTTVSTKSSSLVNRMTQSQKDFFKQAQALGGINMSIEDYAKQLDMTGDLKND